MTKAIVEGVERYVPLAVGLVVVAAPTALIAHFVLGFSFSASTGWAAAAAILAKAVHSRSGRGPKA
jgi:hypothetical protein